MAKKDKLEAVTPSEEIVGGENPKEQPVEKTVAELAPESAAGVAGEHNTSAELHDVIPIKTFR